MYRTASYIRLQSAVLKTRRRDLRCFLTARASTVLALKFQFYDDLHQAFCVVLFKHRIAY